MRMIDQTHPVTNNSTMSTETATDLEMICQAIVEGRKVDPEIAKRVRERSEQLRTATRENLSLDLLREAREE